MSDTPITDAEAFDHISMHGGDDVLVVPAKLAGQLERERNDSRREAERLRDAFPPEPPWIFSWEGQP